MNTAEDRMGNAMLAGIAAFSVVAFVIISSIAAMLTHIIICIKAGSWGLLIAGALLPLIGVIHGWGHWFGVW